VPYDTGHAALAVFTEGLARQLQGSGVRVSIFSPGAKGPRVGQNTRSRGVGRLFSGAARAQGAQGRDHGTDSSVQLEQLASTLIEGLHHSHFLILGDPADGPALKGRWDQVDTNSVSR
jgi:NAD(P)-dependent dehydrogenase (short-subunit alcohol dehydrogenase family)